MNPSWLNHLTSTSSCIERNCYFVTWMQWMRRMLFQLIIFIWKERERREIRKMEEKTRKNDRENERKTEVKKGENERKKETEKINKWERERKSWLINNVSSGWRKKTSYPWEEKIPSGDLAPIRLSSLLKWRRFYVESFSHQRHLTEERISPKVTFPASFQGLIGDYFCLSFLSHFSFFLSCCLPVFAHQICSD